MEEISRSGAHAGACHAQMYVMGSILRHGSEAQKRRYLPKIAAGELRLQSFGVTEPTTGTDTTNLKTTATRVGDRYLDQWPEGMDQPLEHSDLMLAAGAHDGARQGGAQDRRTVRISSSIFAKPSVADSTYGRSAR